MSKKINVIITDDSFINGINKRGLSKKRNFKIRHLPNNTAETILYELDIELDLLLRLFVCALYSVSLCFFDKFQPVTVQFDLALFAFWHQPVPCFQTIFPFVYVLFIFPCYDSRKRDSGFERLCFHFLHDLLNVALRVYIIC